jgi:hypothetical protein
MSIFMGAESRCVTIDGEPPIWHPDGMRALARYRRKGRGSQAEWALLDWGWGRGVAVLTEISLERDARRRTMRIETFCIVRSPCERC